MYVGHPLRERRDGLMSSDTNGVVTNLTARLHPLFKDGSHVCNSNGAVPAEAWQLFISIMQSVRHEPFEDLSLYAQNPLGGLDCIHMILSDDGPNQAKRCPYCWITAHCRT